MLKMQEIRALADARNAEAAAEHNGVHAARREGVVYIATDRGLDENTAKDMAKVYAEVANNDVEFCYFSTCGENPVTLVAIICDASHFFYELGMASAPDFDSKAVVVLEMEDVFAQIEAGYSRRLGADAGVETVTEAISDMLVDAVNEDNQNNTFSDTVFELFPTMAPNEVSHLVNIEDSADEPSTRWSGGGVSMACYDSATAFVYIEEDAEDVLAGVEGAFAKYLYGEAGERMVNTIVLANNKRSVAVEFEWMTTREGQATITEGEEDFGTYETYRSGVGNVAYYAVRSLYWERPSFLS